MTAAAPLTAEQRVDLLLEEIERLRQLAGPAEQSRGESLRADLSRARQTLAAVRQELAIAEAANETLRDEATSHAEWRRTATAALAEARRQRDEARRAANLPVDDGSSDTLALAAERSEHAQTRDKLAAARRTADREYSELSAELDQVRTALLPLWPDQDTASTAALAALTALTVEGYRVLAAHRDRAAGLEPAGPAARPGWLRRVMTWAGLIVAFAAAFCAGPAAVLAVTR